MTLHHPAFAVNKWQYIISMSHVTHMNSGINYPCAVSHICMNRVTCMNESRCTHEWVMSQIWMSHGMSHVRVAKSPYSWVMSLSHVTNLDETLNETFENPVKMAAKIDFCRGWDPRPSASVNHRQTGWGPHQRGWSDDACATLQRRPCHELA